MSTGKIYLIPNTLGESSVEEVIPHSIQIIQSIDHYIVENIRTARRFLIKAGISTPIDDLRFYELNKRTRAEELIKFLKPAMEGNNIGVISEAGCPGVADPGADIVSLAHEKNIRVIPLVGPSSILLSLMASGLNGQEFAFLGYIPIKSGERQKLLKDLDYKIQKTGQTQIFIEAPYRNNQLIKDILTTCKNTSKLCIAVDITLSTENIKTKTISEWKKAVPDIHKRTAIFLLGR